MFSNNSPYVCIFDVEVKKASKMSADQLRWAIADCLECIKLGVNPDKYMDQLSVYREHLAKKVRPKR